MYESSLKLDLLRKSLELRRQELPPDSTTAAQLKHELESVQAASPVASVTYTSLQPFSREQSGGSRGPLLIGATQSAHHYHHLGAPIGRTAAAQVTGKLEVR